MKDHVATKDYARQYRAIWDEIRAAIDRTLLEDEPVLGSALERFEAALARYHGMPHAIGVATGTDAIVLALRALGVGRGDEVVTSAHTFSGVVSAILLAGATPVLVDPEPRYGLLDAPRAESAFSNRTRAILAVHMYGHPIDVESLARLARSRGVSLIEDVAQAHGASFRGRPVGSFGDAAAVSFHPSKNLGAFGDGGAVLVRDAHVADRLRVDRNLGKSGKYEFRAVATNSKLDTLQAAILEVKLRHLDAWVDRRRALAKRYIAALSGVGDLALPREHPEARHAYHLFVVRTLQRDALREHLRTRGVKTGLHYPIAAHRQPALAPHFPDVKFLTAEAFASTGLTLPLSHEHTDDEVDRVSAAVREFYGR